MSMNLQIEKLNSVMKELGYSEDEILKYASVLKEIIKGSNLENVFVQGGIECKIPLLTEYDLINDIDHRALYYFELPHLEHYGAENLFSMVYTGESIPEYCIHKNSILIFKRCEKVTEDGVYAILSRDTVKFSKAEISGDSIRITPLDNKRHLPKIRKTVSALGKMISSINNY